MAKLTLLVLTGFFVFGCAQGPCRTKGLNDQAAKQSEVAKIESIKVYKYDGTLQCGMGSAKKISEYALELGSIKVISSYSRNDGLMRIQLCGSPTGNAHVFEILKTDLEKAQALGFKPWTFD